MLKKVNAVIEGLLFSNGLILIAGAMLGPIYAIFVDEIGGAIYVFHHKLSYERK